MTDFEKIGTNPPWGNLDWSKPSLAVIASDGNDGCVIFTVGPHVKFDIKESGLGNKLSDLGLDTAPAGISIWEGKTAGGGRAPEGDYDDTYLVGTFRDPTDQEWWAIKRGECPWNETRWMLDTVAPVLQEKVRELLDECPIGHNGNGHIIMHRSSTTNDLIAWIDRLHEVKHRLADSDAARCCLGSRFPPYDHALGCPNAGDDRSALSRKMQDGDK